MQVLEEREAPPQPPLLAAVTHEIFEITTFSTDCFRFFSFGSNRDFVFSLFDVFFLFFMIEGFLDSATAQRLRCAANASSSVSLSNSCVGGGKARAFDAASLASKKVRQSIMTTEQGHNGAPG